jgi:hypothetical protein
MHKSRLWSVVVPSRRATLVAVLFFTIVVAGPGGGCNSGVQPQGNGNAPPVPPANTNSIAPAAARDVTETITIDTPGHWTKGFVQVDWTTDAAGDYTLDLRKQLPGGPSFWGIAPPPHSSTHKTRYMVIPQNLLEGLSVVHVHATWTGGPETLRARQVKCTDCGDAFVVSLVFVDETAMAKADEEIKGIFTTPIGLHVVLLP